MKKRLISMLCASTIAFLLALPSYAFDSDMATSAKVNADNCRVERNVFYRFQPDAGCNFQLS